MRLEREYIQEFIDTIYEENKTIVLTAPTGFGKSNFFVKPIVKDLMEHPKKCLLVTTMRVMVDSHQESFFRYVDNLCRDNKTDLYDIVENRSKTSIQFRNGSTIDYKVGTETRGLPSDRYDIIFIDTFREVSSQLHGDLRYLLSGSKKVIITEDSFTRMKNIGDYPCDNIRQMICDHDSFYDLHVDDPTSLMMEIRKSKLKKVYATIQIKS